MGIFKTYLKYVKGHIPKRLTTEKVLSDLATGRRKCWSNPEYVAMRKRNSSETMRRTNEKRKAGAYPSWDEKNREQGRALARRRWADGSARPLGHISSDGFRSSLERQFAFILRESRVAFNFEPRSFPLKDGRSYCPDFYLPDHDLWIEIKGHWWGDSKEKTELFANEYPQLQFVVLKAVSVNRLVAELPACLSWLSPSPEIIRRAREHDAAYLSSDPRRRWSPKSDACTACGTSSRPAQGGGLCVRCYKREWARKRSAAQFAAHQETDCI